MTEHNSYRGRIAPSPTGLLHLGHARTFLLAAERAAHGTLVFRNENLDPDRCRAEFVSAMYEDLRWLNIAWSEGPDCDGPHAPYSQSERREIYLRAWRRLRDGGLIYPCTCSRKELAMAASAPHELDNDLGGGLGNGLDGDLDDEPVYPGKCRGRNDALNFDVPAGVNWRFRVEDGEQIPFRDGRLGAQSYVAGRDFGDFVIWRRDDVPAYQLAVVVDDGAMKISEVVRGADLLKSTARQMLLYRGLGIEPPQFFHCDLLRDETGARLAKRHDALSIRRLRERGMSAAEVRNLSRAEVMEF